MPRRLLGWGTVALMPIVAGAMAYRHMLGIRQLHIQAKHGGIHRGSSEQGQQQHANKAGKSHAFIEARQPRHGKPNAG